MEILFMVFMVVVSVMALFAVMVVFRDVISEVLAARRDREQTDRSIIAYAEKIINEAKEKEKETATVAAPAPTSAPAPIPAPAVVEEPAPEPVVEEAPAPVEAPAEETPAEPAAKEEEPAAEETKPEGNITFSTGQQQTLEEKYLALPAEKRGWYDAIIKYALAVEGSKRIKNARYEEYKVGMNRIVRVTIKRGVIQCEFILHNSDFKNYVNEKKITVKQAATTMLVETAETVEAVKSSIDIVVAAIAEEKEYKKQLAREKRRAQRAAANAANAEAAAETEEAAQ